MDFVGKWSARRAESSVSPGDRIKPLKAVDIIVQAIRQSSNQAG
jgi:hypothetical protein